MQILLLNINTFDYFMIVENLLINNENALREMKRGKDSDISNQVEFLTYIHKMIYYKDF